MSAGDTTDAAGVEAPGPAPSLTAMSADGLPRVWVPVLDYLVELGAALMAAGCPTHRVEEVLTFAARLEGHRVDIFAVPTGLFASLHRPDGGRTESTLVRVREWAPDLERLAALDEVFNQVAARTLSIPEARERIRRIDSRGASWSPPAQLVAAVLATSGAAVSFGGGLVETVCAGLGGLALQLTQLVSARRPGLRVLDNFLGGVLAGVTALVVTQVWPGSSREVLVLAVIIPLLPGLALTTGLAELSYRNLVAGTARLMHATIILVSLVFGIVVVVEVEGTLGLSAPAALARAPAAWPYQVLALLAASMGFAVLVGLAGRRMPLAILSGGLVWGLGALTREVSPALGVFMSSLVLGAASNVYARLSRRPAQLFLMPGMLLLVPGALSFRSLEALLRGDITAGATQFGEVMLVGGALVMGLLVASVVAPSDKAL